jgi:hypothetical protein
MNIRQWAKRQTVQYYKMLNGAKSTMTDERLAKLEQIGFPWTKQ